MKTERLCSRCKINPPKKGKNQYYCLECHAEWMRKNRPKFIDLNAEQKRKATSRAIAGIYKRRGKISQEKCEKCGSSNSQMHHEDYNSPLDVKWLCPDCHIDLHNKEKDNVKTKLQFI